MPSFRLRERIPNTPRGNRNSEPLITVIPRGGELASFNHINLAASNLVMFGVYGKNDK